MINENNDYKGDMIHKWEDNHYGKYVMTALQAGNPKFDQYIGKVVQVRLEAGEWGSDNVLLRHCDGNLMQHTNQCFYLIKENHIEYLNEIYGDVKDIDEPTHSYSLNGKDSKVGFIIESKIKDGESTPMRDVKKAIMNNL